MYSCAKCGSVLVQDESKFCTMCLETSDGQVHEKPARKRTRKADADDGRSGEERRAEKPSNKAPRKNRQSRHPSADKRVIFSISADQLKDVRGF